MDIRKLILACACTFVILAGEAQTQVIAHRGFWKAEGSAQNSITALRQAASAGLYGSELDVQQTKDGVIVVNHDDTIAGYTIGETDYSQLKDLKLKNGETLPTLDDYLEAARGLDIRLILEIKPHPTKGQEDQATATCVSRVKAYGMEKQVEYISFSMNICQQLVGLTPGSEIAYLKSDMTPQEVKAKGLTGIDYYYKVFYMHPEWVKEAQSLGLKVNAWTVNDDDDMQKLVGMGVDYITTDQPLELKELLGQQ